MANQPLTSNHTNITDETTCKIITQPFGQSNVTATEKHQRIICDRTSTSLHGNLQLQNPSLYYINHPNNAITSIQTISEDIPGGKSFTFRCTNIQEPMYTEFEPRYSNVPRQQYPYMGMAPTPQTTLLNNPMGANQYNPPNQNLHYNKYSSTVDLATNISKATPDFMNLPGIVAHLENEIYNDPNVPSALQKVSKLIQLTKTKDTDETQESIRDRDRQQCLKKEDKENQTNQEEEKPPGKKPKSTKSVKAKANKKKKGKKKTEKRCTCDNCKCDSEDDQSQTSCSSSEYD